MSKKVSLFASLEREKKQQAKEEQMKLKQEQKDQRRLEKQEKKQEKKDKKNSDKAVKVRTGTGKRVVISFLISAVFFAICMFILQDMTEGEKTVSLYVAKTHIPENYEISELSFFTVKEVPVSLVPKDAIYNLQTLEGLFTSCGIAENQILTSNLFTDKVVNGIVYQNPIEVAVGTNSIADMVGGTIRRGDLVNISTVISDGKDSTMTVPIIERAYVTNTFTNNGVLVESQDTTQPVTVINVIIDASVEAEFNAALERGSLRISRIVK